MDIVNLPNPVMEGRPPSLCDIFWYKVMRKDMLIMYAVILIGLLSVWLIQKLVDASCAYISECFVWIVNRKEQNILNIWNRIKDIALVEHQIVSNVNDNVTSNQANNVRLGRSYVGVGIEYCFSGPEEVQQRLPYPDHWERRTTNDSQKKTYYRLRLSYCELIFKTHEFDDLAQPGGTLEIDLNRINARTCKQLQDTFMQGDKYATINKTLFSKRVIKDLNSIQAAVSDKSAKSIVILWIVKRRLFYCVADSLKSALSKGKGSFHWRWQTEVVAKEAPGFFNPAKEAPDFFNPSDDVLVDTYGITSVDFAGVGEGDQRIRSCFAKMVPAI